MTDEDTINAAIDANVLINFMHIERLDILGMLSEWTFVAPQEVTNEITDEPQGLALRDAMDAGHVEQTTLSSIDELEKYADFNRTLGKGESACLALALHRGWTIASDEKGTFRRTVIGEIGNERLITTPDIIVQAIHARTRDRGRSRPMEGCAGRVQIRCETHFILRSVMTMISNMGTAAIQADDNRLSPVCPYEVRK